jgi:hypothetical protein
MQARASRHFEVHSLGLRVARIALFQILLDEAVECGRKMDARINPLPSRLLQK